MSVVVQVYRIGNWFHRKKMPIIGKIFTLLNRLVFSTFLPSSATIGDKFTIGYWGLGVVIHTHTKIGNNVTISQNVTIGKNFKDSRVPIIGNDVYIGTGSVIFGDITVGNNVIIGSNSLINKSIPDNCTVVGNPMKIIEMNRKQNYIDIQVRLENY